MIDKIHTILFVQDQEKSTVFYSSLLNIEPQLFVPGMTEFNLSNECILGLMPISGIKKILGSHLFDTKNLNIKPQSEIYLLVNNADDYLKRAAALNAVELSPMQERNWGHKAAYYFDPDNHIIAIAEEL